MNAENELRVCVLCRYVNRKKVTCSKGRNSVTGTTASIPCAEKNSDGQCWDWELDRDELLIEILNTLSLLEDMPERVREFQYGLENLRSKIFWQGVRYDELRDASPSYVRKHSKPIND